MRIAWLFSFIAFAVLANGCHNLTQGDCPDAPSGRGTTLADAASRLEGSVAWSSGQITLSLVDTATADPDFNDIDNCPILSITATLDGVQMDVESAGGPILEQSVSCEESCCPPDVRGCQAIVLTLAAGPNGDASRPLDFILSDESGSREIVVDAPCATSSRGAVTVPHVSKCGLATCDATATCR